MANRSMQAKMDKARRETITLAKEQDRQAITRSYKPAARTETIEILHWASVCGVSVRTCPEGTARGLRAQTVR